MIKRLQNTAKPIALLRIHTWRCRVCNYVIATLILAIDKVNFYDYPYYCSTSYNYSLNRINFIFKFKLLVKITFFEALFQNDKFVI